MLINNRKKRPKHRISRFLRMMGPGLITGAADDDPSGIATYSQAGAQFGFAAAWILPIIYPLMTAVQEACARIGAVTGKGLAAVIRDYYPRKLLMPLVALVVIANTINIGSDIGAMAASVQLIIDVPLPILSIALSILMATLTVLVPYKKYVVFLKWLALALVSYILTAIMVEMPWKTAVYSTLIPNIDFKPEFLYILVAIIGTTISPYLFFWQASEIVEEEITESRVPIESEAPRVGRKYLRNMRVDNAMGMLFSNISAWFILIVAAAVLHSSGVTTINTAADAARALEPLVDSFPYSGTIAKIIFCIGVVGVGLMSVPVLAGSSSYAVSEAFSWKEGLYRKFNEARAFYLVIIISTLVGLLMNFIGINPIKALVFTAVFNSLASIPLLFMVISVVSRKDIMGVYVSRFWSKLGLWSAWALIVVAFLTMLLCYLLA